MEVKIKTKPTARLLLAGVREAAKLLEQKNETRNPLPGKTKKGSPNPAEINSRRAMAIRFYCPLGHRLQAPEDQQGKLVHCPMCGQRVIVPQLDLGMGSWQQGAGGRNHSAGEAQKVLSFEAASGPKGDGEKVFSSLPDVGEGGCLEDLLLRTQPSGTGAAEREQEGALASSAPPVSASTRGEICPEGFSLRENPEPTEPAFFESELLEPEMNAGGVSGFAAAPPSLASEQGPVGPEAGFSEGSFGRLWQQEQPGQPILQAGAVRGPAEQGGNPLPGGKPAEDRSRSQKLSDLSPQAKTPERVWWRGRARGEVTKGTGLCCPIPAGDLDPARWNELRWLGFWLFLIVLFSIGPAFRHLGLATAPGWARWSILLGLWELAYVAWMVLTGHRSALWIAMGVFGAGAAVSALTTAFTLVAAGDRALPAGLALIRRWAPSWFGCVLTVQTLGAYLAGRLAFLWTQRDKQLFRHRRALR